MASTSQDSSSSSRIDDIHFEWKKVQLENIGDFDISSGSSFLWHQQNGRFFAVTASQPRNDLELACFKLEKGSTKAVLERVFRCGKEEGEGVVLSEIFPIVSQCDVTLFRVREPSVTTHALHYLVIFSSSTDPSSSPIISRFFAIPPTMTAQDVHYDAERDTAWVIASERGKRNVNILRVPCYKTRLEASSSSPAKVVLLEDLFYDVCLQLGVAFFIDSGSSFVNFVTLGESKESSSPVALYVKSFNRESGELVGTFVKSAVDIAPFINDFIKSELGENANNKEKEVGIRVTNWRSQFISCQYGLSDSGVLLSAGFNLEISYTKEGASQVNKKRSHCCFAKITQSLPSSDATSPTITFKPLGTCLQEHVILSYFTEDIVLQMDDKHCKLYALSPSSTSSSTFKSISLPEEVSKLQPQNFEIMSIWMPGYFQPKSGYLVIAQASEESIKPLIDVLLLQPVATSASEGSEF